MKRCDPIGLYDSGMGGLSVWRAVRDRLPSESLIYLGDGANCPYGSRSFTEIKEFADRAVGELVARGCKLVVVACNTATAAAIVYLREKYNTIDLVAMEPAVKPACLNTKSGVVGVLATERSLEGGHFQRTAARYSAEVKIIPQFGKGFVEIVESGTESSAEAEATVRAVVEPMLAAGADEIVLGCSHYPFLIPLLKKIAPGIDIIDPSTAVARRVEQLLREHDLLCEEGTEAVTYDFISFLDEEYNNRLRARAYKQ